MQGPEKSGQFATLNRGQERSYCEKLRLERGEGVSFIGVCVKSYSGRSNSQCKRTEVEAARFQGAARKPLWLQWSESHVSVQKRPQASRFSQKSLQQPRRSYRPDSHYHSDFVSSFKFTHIFNYWNKNILLKCIIIVSNATIVFLVCFLLQVNNYTVL